MRRREIQASRKAGGWSVPGASREGGREEGRKGGMEGWSDLTDGAGFV